MTEDEQIERFRSEVSGPIRHLVASAISWFEMRYRRGVDEEATRIARIR